MKNKKQKTEKNQQNELNNNHQKTAKKRKKWPWILLAILLILAIGLVILAKWQWNNIMAIHYATKYTSKQLSEMQMKNESALQEMCEEVSGVDITRLSEEAEKHLQTGKLSQEDAVAILIGEKRWDEETKKAVPVEPSLAEGETASEGTEQSGNSGDTQTADTTQLANGTEASGGENTTVDNAPANSGNSASSEKVATNTSGQNVANSAPSRVDEIIAQMYVLRSGYMGQLDGLVVQGWREYIRGEISKQGAISKYIGIGNSLEGQCDAQMESLLSELQTELVRIGGDTGLIGQIRQTYQSQKSIKKAEMIAKYQ